MKRTAEICTSGIQLSRGSRLLYIAWYTRKLVPDNTVSVSFKVSSAPVSNGRTKFFINCTSTHSSTLSLEHSPLPAKMSGYLNKEKQLALATIDPELDAVRIPNLEPGY